MSIEEQTTTGAVNWEAYSHDELYQMLWQDADVADVSAVATEWAQHRAALDTHAEVLREQRAAMLADWHGPAAQEAAGRLDTLAARVEKISELAHAGQLAAQEAADALAMARTMMPPPPTTSANWTSAQFGPPIPEVPAFSPAPNYSEMFAAPAVTTPSGSDLGTSFGAVGSAGFSFYFGAVATDQQKAQAVRSMQTYESSLMGSGRMIDEARGAIPPATSMARTGGTTVSTRVGTGGGVPWSRLVGAGPVPAAGIGAGVDPVIGRPGSPPGPGPRVEALPGLSGGRVVSAGPFAAEPGGARAATPGGMMPPIGGPRGSDDERHENQLPTTDHGLFTIELPTSPAVIGGPTGAQL